MSSTEKKDDENNRGKQNAAEYLLARRLHG